MRIELLSAVVLSVATVGLFLNWAATLVGILIFFSAIGIAFHVWLYAKIIRERLRELQRVRIRRKVTQRIIRLCAERHDHFVRGGGMLTPPATTLARA